LVFRERLSLEAYRIIRLRSSFGKRDRVVLAFIDALNEFLKMLRAKDSQCLS
jgi:hypothetical protein